MSLIATKDSSLFKNVLLIVLSLLVINMRPGIIGERFSIWLVGLGAFVLLMLFSTNNARKARQYDFNIFFLLSLVLLYFFLVSLVNADNLRPVVSGLVLAQFGLFSVFLGTIFSRNFFWIFNKTLVYYLTILAISCALTVCGQLIGLDLLIGPIQTHQGGFVDGYAAIYFPFTILGANGFSLTDSIVIERFFGAFREPGVLQAYIVYAIVLVLYYPHYFSMRRLVLPLLIFALLVSFSVAGWMLFGFVFLLVSVKKKSYFFLGLVPFFLLSFFFIDDFLYLLRGRLVSESFSDRFGSLVHIWEFLRLKPFFGYGLFQNIPEISTVNFLGSIVTLGVVGFLVYLTPWLFFISTKFKFKVMIFPFLATFLFLQPIFMDPIVFVLLYLLQSRDFFEKDRIRS